jgi:hypothetical protein
MSHTPRVEREGGRASPSTSTWYIFRSSDKRQRIPFNGEVLYLGLISMPARSTDATCGSIRSLQAAFTRRPVKPLVCIQSTANMATAAVNGHSGGHEHVFDIDNSAAVISNEPAKIYEEYDYLRKRCPVIHTSQYGGYWLLTRYDDVKAAAMDSETFISSVKAVVPSDPRGIRRPPLNFDAPAHTPFRTALERTVKPARLTRLRKPLEKAAREELAPLLARGYGDISAEFAANFVARMEAEWLNRRLMRLRYSAISTRERSLI